MTENDTKFYKKLFLAYPRNAEKQDIKTIKKILKQLNFKFVDPYKSETKHEFNYEKYLNMIDNDKKKAYGWEHVDNDADLIWGCDSLLLFAPKDYDNMIPSILFHKVRLTNNRELIVISDMDNPYLFAMTDNYCKEIDDLLNISIKSEKIIDEYLCNTCLRQESCSYFRARNYCAKIGECSMYIAPKDVVEVEEVKEVVKQRRSIPMNEEETGRRLG